MGAQRKLPVLNEDTGFFWTSGAEGVLKIQHCSDCGNWQHPPMALCGRCHGGNVGPAPVKGTGGIKTFTVNVQAWTRDLTEPFVYAAIELDEQDGLYVYSNVLAPVEQVRSGQRVKVTFEQHEDVWLPLFVPENGNG